MGPNSFPIETIIAIWALTKFSEKELDCLKSIWVSTTGPYATRLLRPHKNTKKYFWNFHFHFLFSLQQRLCHKIVPSSSSSRKSLIVIWPDFIESLTIIKIADGLKKELQNYFFDSLRLIFFEIEKSDFFFIFAKKWNFFEKTEN